MLPNVEKNACFLFLYNNNEPHAALRCIALFSPRDLNPNEARRINASLEKKDKT